MFKNSTHRFMDRILPIVGEYIKEHLTINIERNNYTIRWTTSFADTVISTEEIYIGPLDIEPPPWPFAEPAVDKPEA
jgi:hypothetical protein